MKAKNGTRRFAVILVSFIGMGAMAQAHPGTPGHYHPGEVDEFDEISLVSESSLAKKDFDLGGFLVFMGVSSCLAFALCQKQGGIWSDVVSKH